jgi:hypothetical protein
MAGRYNMVCDQGSTFSLTFTIKTDGTAWNLVGNYTAKMQVRSFLNADTVLIELTTANSRISFLSRWYCYFVFNCSKYNRFNCWSSYL